MRKATDQEIKRATLINQKLKKYINIAVTIISVIALCIVAVVKIIGSMSNELFGILFPGFLAILCLMNVFAMKDEKRKAIMIFYIILLSVCLIALFFDVVYYNFYK